MAISTASLPVTTPRRSAKGYGQLATWFCRLPAQPRKRQVRSVFVSAGAAACMAPIFGPPSWQPSRVHTCGATRWRSWKRSGGLLTTTTLFHGDVGHTLVLGATGAGKILHAEFSAGTSPALELSAGASPAVRSPRSDSRFGRLLPLADPLSGRRLSGTLPRRRPPAAAEASACGPSRCRQESGPTNS